MRGPHRRKHRRVQEHRHEHRRVQAQRGLARGRAPRPARGAQARKRGHERGPVDQVRERACKLRQGLRGLRSAARCLQSMELEFCTCLRCIHRTDCFGACLGARRLLLVTRWLFRSGRNAIQIPVACEGKTQG